VQDLAKSDDGRTGSAARHGRRPLSIVARKIAPVVPLVAGLGLLASLLEGAGIGLLIPFLALLISNSPAADVPEPIHSLASFFERFEPQTSLILLGAAIFGLILVKSVVQAANEYLLASIQGRIGRIIREGLAKRLLSADYSFFLANDPVRLNRILSTDSWFVLQTARALLSLTPAAAGLLVFSILLATLNLNLFMIVALGAIALQAVLALAERRQRRLSNEFTASHHDLWERFLTLLQAARLIRLFGQQGREQQRAEQASERLRKSIVATGYQSAIINPLLEAMIALLFLGVVLGGYSMGMSVPEITAFILLLTRAQPHAKTIAQARLGMASFHGSVREVDWLLSQPECVPAATSDTGLRLDKPILFDRVSYAYPDGSRAFEDVTLTFEPGMATAVIGPSGSGKTTLVNLLCRLIEPQAGDIRHGDDPIRTIDVDAWRGRIAVAGQDIEPVIGTIAENIAYGRPNATAAEIAEAARAAGVDRFVAGLPQGYETRVGPEGLSLSGGQRQRIGVARALLRRPDLLILDEATNAVDALSETEIMTLIREHRYFRTILVISHRKSTLSLCERGIVLEEGKVKEAGPLADLAYFNSMAGSAGATSGAP